jgi:hypothetical protein
VWSEDDEIASNEVWNKSGSNEAWFVGTYMGFGYSGNYDALI